jgi:hypothetical protein
MAAHPPSPRRFRPCKRWTKRKIWKQLSDSPSELFCLARNDGVAPQWDVDLVVLATDDQASSTPDGHERQNTNIPIAAPNIRTVAIAATTRVHIELS